VQRGHDFLSGADLAYVTHNAVAAPTGPPFGKERIVVKFAASGRTVRAAALPLVALLGAGLASCGHTPQLPHPKWPFSRAPAAAPQPVSELVVEPAAGTVGGFLQFWDRNTLLIDLRSVSGSGAATLRRRAGAAWPVRLAFRVSPASIGELEVRGDVRVLFPIAAAEGGIVLKLSPDVYSENTNEIRLAWAPAPAAAP
jgi:hypothetical protein